MQGQEPDEKMQPILRIEQPTDALMDVGCTLTRAKGGW
jgi:hypothetical protein